MSKISKPRITCVIKCYLRRKRRNKNGRESFDNLPFCTQDDSVLELLYKDLVQLYDLRIPLKQEGLSNYSVNPNFLRDKRTNTLLQ